MIREDTKLVQIFLDKSLVLKTQIGFINDNIEKTKERLKMHVRQASIVDPFDVISNVDINNESFNISFPKHIITSNLLNFDNNSKNALYDKIESEMYCNLSIVLFDNLIGYLNYIIKLCNNINYNDIDNAIYAYQKQILNDKTEDIFCHTIFMKKKIGHLEDKLMPNECFGIIKSLFKEEFESFESLIKKNIAGTDCITFFNTMEKYREFIVYHNAVIPEKYKKKISFYSYIKDGNNLKLTLNHNEIENLIEIYNQTIYIIYKALITKYNLENEIKKEVNISNKEAFEFC